MTHPDRRAGRRIEAADSAALCPPRAGQRHPHLVCRRCGAVTDVDLVASPALCLEPAARAGFQVERAEVTFWGRCSRCRAGGAPPAAGTRVARR